MNAVTSIGVFVKGVTAAILKTDLFETVEADGVETPYRTNVRPCEIAESGVRGVVLILSHSNKSFIPVGEYIERRMELRTPDVEEGEKSIVLYAISLDSSSSTGIVL